ncbi:ATP synthase protein I [Nitrosospira briensis]|uniref:ATP synthase protein I n=1 Tax=Nitrosospira briensis TaxID=35799 RepID=A0A1I4XXG3_9PROT|nr:AtpZ/AtpI family protein [Nitrosospira briensis]SFN30043.1 ATP synthase protein I [Nitrosospira briensis]
MSNPLDEKRRGGKPVADEPELSRLVGARAKRKLKAQREQGHIRRTVWSGLSMIGLVGWSVVVPTLLGAALGVWLDRRHAMSHSWTLTLLFAGLLIGCLNAWHWVVKEDRETHKQQGQQEDRDE